MAVGNFLQIFKKVQKKFFFFFLMTSTPLPPLNGTDIKIFFCGFPKSVGYMKQALYAYAYVAGYFLLFYITSPFYFKKKFNCNFLFVQLTVFLFKLGKTLIKNLLLDVYQIKCKSALFFNYRLSCNAFPNFLIIIKF